MRNKEIVQQMVKHTQTHKVTKGESGSLEWWELSLIGLGSIIGAGFFLGSSLSIKMAGPLVLLAYLVSGVAAFIAFAALSEMSLNHPETGSFRAYAKDAFGERMGFTSGWIYWISGVFIMSSEVSALSIFTRYWFPQIPAWIFALIYSVLGLGIILMGVKDFGRVESIFAVIKISALTAFIIFGLLYAAGLISAHGMDNNGHRFLLLHTSWLPNGFNGLWSAMLFTLFPFGGIAVLGITAVELKDKTKILKAGNVLMALLLALYLISIFFVLNLVPLKKIVESQSPFVTALSQYNLPGIDSIFNIIIITAAFSTMVGTLFAITKVLYSLAEDNEAPRLFIKTTQKRVPINALLLSAIGLAASIILSYLLPGGVYEYVTSSASILLVANWIIILLSQIKNRKNYPKGEKHFLMPGYPYLSYFGILIILFALCGTLLKSSQRIAMLVSIVIALLIFGGYVFMKRKTE